MFFPYFSPEGNFDIDAGDGCLWVGGWLGGWVGGDYLGPQIQNNLKKTICTKIVHTSGTFPKNVKNNPSYIQKTNALQITIYNTNQQSKNTFQKNPNISNISNIHIHFLLSSKWSAFLYLWHYLFIYIIIHIFIYIINSYIFNYDIYICVYMSILA